MLITLEREAEIAEILMQFASKLPKSQKKLIKGEDYRAPNKIESIEKARLSQLKYAECRGTQYSTQTEMVMDAVLAGRSREQILSEVPIKQKNLIATIKRLEHRRKLPEGINKNYRVHKLRGEYEKTTIKNSVAKLINSGHSREEVRVKLELTPHQLTDAISKLKRQNRISQGI